MKPVLAVVPREEPARSEEAPPKNRSRSTNPLRKRIMRDSRQASRGYILSFTVPAGGE